MMKSMYMSVSLLLIHCLCVSLYANEIQSPQISDEGVIWHADGQKTGIDTWRNKPFGDDVKKPIPTKRYSRARQQPARRSSWRQRNTIWENKSNGAAPDERPYRDWIEYEKETARIGEPS
jgi:hypothetical protein